MSKLTVSRAAAHFNIDQNALEELRRLGIVSGGYVEGEGTVVNTAELEAFNRSLPRRGYLTERQLYAAFRSLAAKVEGMSVRLASLQERLGLDIPFLERDEPTAMFYFRLVQEAVEPANLSSAAWVRDWAGILFNIDETMLLIIADAHGEKEPWKPFYDFAAAIVAHAPGETLRHSADLQNAYKYFEAARTNFRLVAYLACKTLHGTKMADVVFGKTPKTATDIVLSYLNTMSDR